MKSASEFVFPVMWVQATAIEVRSRSAAYRWTICWPCSDLEETLCPQFCDGLLSVRIRSFARLGIPPGNFLQSMVGVLLLLGL